VARNTLTERGATVEQAAIVRDRIDDIAAIISRFYERYDAVLSTGGLGPTHDDLTMDAVAQAFDREVQTSEEVVEWLETYDGYKGDAADTTVLPANARVLHNEEGVAPGCVVESIYVFPGIPEEMKPMFESVANEVCVYPQLISLLSRRWRSVENICTGSRGPLGT
jgi:molybdenum cofactor synthesis domain-containing protein